MRSSIRRYTASCSRSGARMTNAPIRTVRSCARRPTPIPPRLIDGKLDRPAAAAAGGGRQPEFLKVRADAGVEQNRLAGHVAILDAARRISRRADRRSARTQRHGWKSTGQVVGEIAAGLVALVGVTHSDTTDLARRLADKTAALRVFATASGHLTEASATSAAPCCA